MVESLVPQVLLHFLVGGTKDAVRLGLESALIDGIHNSVQLHAEGLRYGVKTQSTAVDVKTAEFEGLQHFDLLFDDFQERSQLVVGVETPIEKFEFKVIGLEGVVWDGLEVVE